MEEASSGRSTSRFIVFAELVFEGVLGHSGLPHHAYPQCIILKARWPMFPLFQRRSPCSTWKRTWGRSHLQLVSQKVAEEFVVEDVVKPAVLDVIHGNQYEAIPKSSTTMALTSMLYAWSLVTDGNWTTVENHVICLSKGTRFYWPQYFNW